MTPEGKVKRAVRKAIAAFEGAYSYWPVPAGYGPSSLDALICVNGHFLAIETKAPGKIPTPRQAECIRRIERAGGTVLIIDSERGAEEVTATMERLSQDVTRPGKS